MAYANAEERGSLVSGLRDAADFLEQNPEVPAPRCADLMVFPPATSTEQEMRTEVDRIAALIGTPVKDDTADEGHYTTARQFGPVQYQAVAIPARCRELRRARMSYTENIILPEPREEA